MYAGRSSSPAGPRRSSGPSPSVYGRALLRCPTRGRPAPRPAGASRRSPGSRWGYHEPLCRLDAPYESALPGSEPDRARDLSRCRRWSTSVMAGGPGRLLSSADGRSPLPLSEEFAPFLTMRLSAAPAPAADGARPATSELTPTHRPGRGHPQPRPGSSFPSVAEASLIGGRAASLVAVLRGGPAGARRRDARRRRRIRAPGRRRSLGPLPGVTRAAEPRHGPRRGRRPQSRADPAGCGARSEDSRRCSRTRTESLDPRLTVERRRSRKSQ